MPQWIIYKDGAYNLFSTVVDAPVYESALTSDQLREAMREKFGQTGLDALPERLDRAHKTGCSSIDGTTLLECIAGNRSGPKEAEMPAGEFIERFLTLPVLIR
jgi:hypothetical protein